MDARYRLKFKKRREGKTNYKKRYNLLLSKEPRIVVRITNKQIIAETIEYSTQKGDKTVAYASSNDLTAYGWTQAKKNTSAAYLTGLLCAKRATEKKIKSGIADFGLHTVHAKGRLFAAIKGALDGGLKIPHDDAVFPDEKRLSGTHLKTDATKEFEKVKENILKAKQEKKDKKKETTTKTTPKTKKKDKE
ncbi:MAG: 50S ribosomal protein L18 [archaeon]